VCPVVTDLHTMIADVGYVTSGQNPGRSEPYDYTLNVCSNSSVACMEQGGTAAACQRDTGNNETFVLGRLSQQTLRYHGNYSSAIAAVSDFMLLLLQRHQTRMLFFSNC